MVESTRTVIYQATTELDTYEIVEELYTGRPSRLLYSGKIKTAQSGIPLDDINTMLFEYTQRLVEVIEDSAARDILMIGGGAYTLPSYIIKKHKNIRFDVVEPDKDLKKISKMYFNLEPSDQINIINDFGLHYLKNTKKKYDLIILDAYQQESIPKEILSKKFAKLAAGSLNDKGLLAANVITSLRADAVVFNMHDSCSRYFNDFRIYPVTNDTSYYYPHNLIYVASLDKVSLRLKHPALRHLEFGG